jgi:hypothetical protein
MEERAVTPTWRTSSYTGNGGGNCVEVGSTPALVPGAIVIRDTKDRGAGPVLRVSAETWRAFLTTLHR